MSWFGAIEHPFTRWHVELYAPPRPGVYALRTADRWIYIGESENVQQRLLEHVLAPDACIASHAPTSFGVELLHAEGRALRRAELLVEFAPVCR